jgi:hypothetical protein
MFFVCYHQGKRGAQFLVGANQENWSGLPAIGSIRRGDRNHRLVEYIPFAKRAYDSLREAEKSVKLPQSYASKPAKELSYETRRRAVALMRKPHHDFLGRTTEQGQAFNAEMKPSQCCYVCQGMMGYKVGKEFSNDDVKSYLTHFRWEMRKGYAHSCAEICVSLQCAAHWEQEGKSIRT